jgi:hypothetical protein
MALEPEHVVRYVAELYTPGCTGDRLKADAERIRAAAEAAAAGGEPVAYLDSLLLPDEETALHFFEAEGPDPVERTLHEAGLDAERISPAIAAAEMRAKVARDERR